MMPCDKSDLMKKCSHCSVCNPENSFVLCTQSVTHCHQVYYKVHCIKVTSVTTVYGAMKSYKYCRAGLIVAGYKMLHIVVCVGGLSYAVYCIVFFIKY